MICLCQLSHAHSESRREANPYIEAGPRGQAHGLTEPAPKHESCARRAGELVSSSLGLTFIILFANRKAGSHLDERVLFVWDGPSGG